MIPNDKWFTEEDTRTGTAFSLRLGQKLQEEQTPWQHIAIYATETFGKLMVIDGCIMLTSRDNFLYHEMMAHPILRTHPAPRRVAIIGGGDCGTLTEVLKHPEVEEVVQVDIDKRVTRLSERYFPELCQRNADTRVRFHFEDGIRWLREAPAGSLDVIIVDSTDPVGPAQGLFTRPFHESCLRALGEDGMVVQQSESPLLHESLFRSIGEHLRQAGFARTRALHFPQPVYPSGWWSATLAGKRDFSDRPRSDEMLPGVRYYNADIHRAAMAQPTFLRK